MQLLCLGDVAFATPIPTAWRLPGGLRPREGERILFNWEFPIGEKVNPIPRASGRRFLAHASAVDAVRGWSPGFATLATNHVLDAGSDGLSKTMQALQQAGFATLGAGTTRERAAEPALWETGEGRLAIVNWVFPETHPDWLREPGPNCWPGSLEARRTIRKVKGSVDWVLVVLHWSDELFPYPRPEDRATASELAQAGADLVVCHHPHVVRGMEIIGSCPVFYSLGDFYFSDICDDRGNWIVRRAPRNREGLGVEITFARATSPTFEVLSFWQEASRVVADTQKRAVRRMEWASAPLHTFQDSQYAKWYGVQRSRFDRWGARWHFGVRKLGWRGMVQRASGLLPSRFA